MTKSSFDDLLGLVYDRLVHAPTHRSPISPAERLAITLRYGINLVIGTFRRRRFNNQYITYCVCRSDEVLFKMVFQNITSTQKSPSKKKKISTSTYYVETYIEYVFYWSD